MAGDETARSPLKKALVAVRELKARVAELEGGGATAGGAVAITGIGCRFPGGAEDPERFWQVVRAGASIASPVPRSRWDARRWPDLPARAGFLDDVDRFDATFFGIRASEAAAMDPVQRLLLETTWHALEDAQLRPSTLPKTGVWLGLGLSDYGRRTFLGDDPEALGPFSGTGTFLSVASGRIAYALGLRGPAITVDTACSSSLVATHLAIRALREREVDVALVAGANLLLSPIPSAYFQALGALSPDGSCKTFAANADGYGRGEGVGVLVLRRLEDAERLGDPIRAVIRGSAVNQDGRSNGLTAPSGLAQQAVIRAALADAKLAPRDLAVVEAHGTGTPLGDPIEVEALQAVLPGAIHLGSAKTVFGHTETAAGVAGLIKAVLQLEHRELCPHPQAAPNPRLDLTRVTLPPSPTPWPEVPTRIGVSSFGLSGTNAHVIVEAAPERPPASVDGPGSIVLSARSEPALERLVRATAAGWNPERWREAEAESVQREPLPYRIGAASLDPEALPLLLERARIQRSEKGRSVWMFTGQGSQWPGMGRVLYEREPVFAEVVDRVAAVVPDLWEAMQDERIHDTRYTQPALFALQCGLVRLLEPYRIPPDAVLGHSIGAYAAAWLAGVFSLEDGARLVEARGRLMSELPREGAMLAVFAGPSRVPDLPEGVEVAARNHPDQSVYSGTDAGIDALEAACEERGLEVRRLAVSHPFHSAAMEPMLPAFRAVVEQIERKRPMLEWISTVDGQPVGDRVHDPDYWVRQLRQPVQLVQALHRLREHRFFLEVGPQPVLCGAGARTLPDACFVPTLQRDRQDGAAVLAAVTALWTHGVDVDLRPDRPRLPRAGLPPMPFARERHWIEAEGLDLAPEPEVRAWKPSPAPAGRPHGRWWVHGDERYADALEGAGCQVVRIDAELPSEPPDGVLVVAEPSLRPGPTLTLALRILQQVQAPLSVVVQSGRPSGLPALLRVVANERPAQAGALIWDPDAPERVLAELAAGTPEVRLAGERAIPGRVALGPSIPRPLPERVWITGASGVLGRALARAIAPKVRQLVLLSRSGIDEVSLLQLGAHVRSVQGDVTDNLVPLAAEAPPQLIFHLAGVLEDALLAEVDEALLERVAHPKVDGAWRLHEVAPDAELVLMGSAAALLGNPGQAAYAVANGWLEGFASWRRGQGGPTWTLALGPVAGTPMVQGHEERMRAEGLQLLTVDQAVQHLVDARTYEAPVLLAAPRRQAPTSRTTEQGSRRVAEGGSPTRSLEEHVDRALAAVLGSVPSDDTGFFDAGMDSLGAQDLRARLERALGIALPVTQAFDTPTRSALLRALRTSSSTAATAPRSAGSDRGALPSSSSAVAIVGLAVRVPGADDLDAFWDLLDAGRDVLRPIDRWSLDRYASDSPMPGRHVAREAGLLSDVAGFDAARFGISPREAARLDPQQRLVLEASLAALEHANLEGEPSTGVFVGIGPSEYGRRFDPFDSEPDPFAGTGNQSSFAAGRVSHALGLQGPALSIDTACSSSLVAIHLARRALLDGECRIALAGGVHVLAGPESTVQLTQLGALSPSSRCRTFSADADGYARGEGVGMVVLKPLEQARADGDFIWAVIEGSAVNHDGRSAGVTVPNGTAQRAVLRAALADAGIEPGQVDAIEAHGTGTPLGDPIEIGAVRDVYLQGRTRPLAIGSVKTNIGHLEAGAGIAGVVKMVLALRHQRLPAHLHCERLNPEIDGTGLEIPRSTRAWVGQRAGVSSFGISGTNAHLVLARGELEAPDVEPRTRVLRVASSPTASVVPFEQALSAPQALALARRPAHAHRAWSVGGLAAVTSTVEGARAWLFTGQGVQQPGLGAALLQEPVFRERWAWGIAHLGSLGFDTAVFDDERVNDTANAQPQLFLFGLALAEWFRSRGLVPDFVAGHSLGELTAATFAGVWTPEEALALVVARGRLMGALPRGGASFAVFTDVATAEAAIGADPVDIAGVNGPSELVLAGDEAAVEAVLSRIGARHKRLNASHPFHSRWMEPAVSAFTAEVAKTTPRAPRIPVISNLDGRPLGARVHDPSYWAQLIRRPVRFHDGVEQLWARGCRVFFEVGPRPILAPMVARSHPGARTVASQGRDADALDALYGAVGALWAAGDTPDWEAVTGATTPAPAPPTPRTHLRHWVERPDEDLPASWFHRLLGPLDTATPDLAATLTSAQQAVRDGSSWAPDASDPATLGFARSFALEHPSLWAGSEPQRLEPGAPIAPVRLRPDGTYLVTGGTGSLGRALVQQLVGQQRTVLVTSRSGAEVEGAESHAVPMEELAAWLEGRTVHGVIHAAGVGARVPLLEETPEGLEAMLAPKRAEVFEGLDLDFFVGIGSIAQVWGSAGQTAYAAANGLVALTVERLRECGVDARYVALGPVQGGLLDAEGARWLAERGIPAITPSQAARAALRADGVVADVRWSAFLPIQTARLAQPLFEAYQPRPTAVLPKQTLHRVHAEAARVLGMQPADLPVDQGLFDAGMDSVTAVELAKALSTEGAELPATLVFEHGTVSAIAAFLEGNTEVAPRQVHVVDSPVVLVAMACRFPGGVDSPEAYWELLSEGRDAVGPIPAERWDAEAFYAPEPATPGHAYVREAAFIDGVDRFDPLFFGIAPREAAALDPQQRLLLELSHQALERANLTADLPRTGVFVGLPESSYLQRFRAAGQPLYPDAYAGTGNESSFAAGRINHVLGARGPAISLNTACSTSLVTVHLAAEALRHGDCDVALAGGASLMLSPDNTIYLSQLRALAPDGRCKTFSAEADGYGRGEGAGIVVLMREEDARQRGLPILARVLGTAVNHDGASSGLTVPNGTAQEEVIREAVERAGIEPAQVGYVEAHGTGTQLGDPIEIAALRRALGDGERFVGSVKTQIGHLEQAAGVAALIKVVLQLRHRALAPHLHLGELNPRLDLGSLRIPTVLTPWEGTVAGVSGFGLSGTNAHLVIGAGEPIEPVSAEPALLPLSAGSPGAVARLREQLAPLLEAHGGAVGANLLRRAAHPVRAIDDGPAVRVPAAPRLVLLFTGQGAQRIGMDEALYRDEPVYREAFDEVAALFGLDRAVLADARIDETRHTQRALFAMEWALASWWRSLGVEADFVLGHSIGELVAAAWAGMLRLPDAVRLVAARADAMADQPGGGAMTAVFVPDLLVRQVLVEGAEIAGVNGPESTVIAGDREAVAATVAALGVEGRSLPVSHAFHTAAMDGAREAVTQVAAEVRWFVPRVPVVRNLDGALHDGAPEPTYWGDQLRQAVRFADGVRTLIDAGATTWLEVGPHPTLAGLVRALAPEAVAVGSVVAGDPQLERAAGALWTHGFQVPLQRWLPDVGYLALPPTPQDRTRVWLDLPEFPDQADPLSELLFQLVFDPIAGDDLFTGETVEIAGPDAPTIWARLLDVALPAAQARRNLRFVVRDTPLLGLVQGFVRSARRELQLDWRLVQTDGSEAVLPDDPWLRVRDGRASAARLVRGAERRDRDWGTVLITGGFGGLGVALARALKDQVRVVLLGRTLRQEILDALGVDGVAADVTDADALRRALAGRSIDTVVHAAGVLADGPLGQPWAAVEPVFRTKLDGALALREVLGDAVSYVFYSSASAVLGAPGQTAYAAANAGLDALAAAWRDEGLDAVSLDWGPWDEVGMAAALDPAVVARQRAEGVRRLPVAAAVEAAAVCAGGVALAMDWPRFLEVHGEPLFTPLGWAPRRVERAGWTPAQGLETLPAWLDGIAREVLRIPAERALPVDQPLQELGLDSLMAVTLRNRLAVAGLEVPVARLIGGPSIEEITAMARAQLAPVQPEVEEEELGLFHPLVTHAMIALLALMAGGLIGWTIFAVQAPPEQTQVQGDRAPRTQR